MTKIDIFSGFLGAGKTTLIKKLIKEAFKNEKVVIIENEFGEIGIDGGFLKDSGIQITEMNSGCICCSLVGDFKTALSEVVSTYAPDRIIIEPSGVGKLSDVIKAVKGVDIENVKLNSFTTVADISKIKVYMKNFGEFYNNQIEYANCIVLSRTANVSNEKTDMAIKLIREHNKTANIVTTDWDVLSAEKLLEVMENSNSLEEELKKLEEEHHHDEECHHEHHHDEECHHEHHHDEECHHEHHHDEECSCGCHDHHHHHHADDVFTSWGIETAHKFTLQQIKEILNKFDEDTSFGSILRAKGIVAGENEFIHFDYVPGEADVRTGAADAIGKICVIGSKLNEDKLKELFGV